MKKTYDAIEKIKSLFSEVQSYVRIAMENEKDDPLEVLLPFSYQFLTKREDIVEDQHALILVGNYFATKFPHLKEHFISQRQIDSASLLEGLLTEHYEGSDGQSEETQKTTP